MTLALHFVGSNPGTERLSLQAGFFLCLSVSASFLLASVKGNCSFPAEWSGKWFQGGRGDLGLVEVNITHFSNGLCIEEGKASRYFVYVKEEACNKCVVIHKKHHNVLQYKQSFCDPSAKDMTSACDTITGDNSLHWMFRWNADIVSCPFKGPLIFTYSKGWEKECKNPVSQVDSCADDMRLLFRQQACPDVPNSQSKEEELVCLGSWKDGSDHYFAGKINHSHAFTNEDRYRCFMYEKSRQRHFMQHPSEEEEDENEPLWHLTMSNDAACQSLNSVTDAAKIMKLRKPNHNNKKCKFPSWLSDHIHWHTLDFAQSYFIYARDTSLKISNGTAPPENVEVRGHTDLRLICHKYESFHESDFRKERRGGHLKEHHNHADQVTIIVHFTVGCHSGYRCMRAYRRQANVVQVQFGNDALNSKEACNNIFWDPSTAEYITLVAQGENKGTCGPLGNYHIPENQNIMKGCNHGDSKASSFTHLMVGCSQHDTLELHEICPTQEVDSYQCYGEWKSDGVTYVVASPVSRPSGSPKRVCFSYTTIADPGEALSPPSLVFTARHDTCIARREDAHLTLNATLIGSCTQVAEIASGAHRHSSIPSVLGALYLVLSCSSITVGAFGLLSCCPIFDLIL